MTRLALTAALVLWARVESHRSPLSPLLSYLAVWIPLLEVEVHGSAAPTIDDGWWLFTAVHAPALLAAVMEELFFRDVLLRTLEREAGPRRGPSQ